VKGYPPEREAAGPAGLLPLPPPYLRPRQARGAVGAGGGRGRAGLDLPGLPTRPPRLAGEPGSVRGLRLHPLVRHPGRCGVPSVRACRWWWCGRLAQPEERRPYKAKVGGSSPSAPTSKSAIGGESDCRDEHPRSEIDERRGWRDERPDEACYGARREAPETLNRGEQAERRPSDLGRSHRYGKVFGRLHASDPDPSEDEAEEQDEDAWSCDRKDGVGEKECDHPSSEDDARSRAVTHMPGGNTREGRRGVVADIEQERDARRRVVPTRRHDRTPRWRTSVGRVRRRTPDGP
jgi:hypothetical protein